MPGQTTTKTQLCLVTPADLPDGFPALLDSVLAGGRVASLILAPGVPAALIEPIGTVAARHGVAAIVAGALPKSSSLDGIHFEGDAAALKAAVALHHPQRIVGAGGIASRHDAMTFGEADVDYLFFGRLDGDVDPAIFDKALDLAAWWAELFEIPAIVMGGSALDSLGPAVAAGIEFVALRRAVWDHPSGPVVAIAEANRLLLAEPAP